MPWMLLLVPVLWGSGPAVKRTQLLVLERDGKGKIRRVLDDW